MICFHFCFHLNGDMFFLAFRSAAFCDMNNITNCFSFIYAICIVIFCQAKQISLKKNRCVHKTNRSSYVFKSINYVKTSALPSPPIQLHIAL